MAITLDLDGVVQIYKENIDALIVALGKDCKLVFKPTTTNVNPEFYDNIGNSLKHPGFFAPVVGASKPVETENSSTIKALTQWNPKEMESYQASIQQNVSIVRIKTFLRHLPDLLRAEYIVPDVKSEKYHGAKFRLCRRGIPRGLQTSEYCVTYWEEISGVGV